MNEYEELLKSNSSKFKSLNIKIEEKNRIIEENKDKLNYYNEKYMKESEERGNEESKVESGSEANQKSQLINITDLNMKQIEVHHKLERLEFYESNNKKLLKTIEVKEEELNSKITSLNSKINSLKDNHKEEIEKINKNHARQLEKEKNKCKKEIEKVKTHERKNADDSRKELREEFQKMFSDRLAEWKKDSDEYENRIKYLENMVNNS